MNSNSFDERVTRRLLILRDWCQREGIELTPADEVSEEAAARALGYRPKSDALATQRNEGRLSPLLRVRRQGKRYFYDLHSIALDIETKYDAMLAEHVSRDAMMMK